MELLGETPKLLGAATILPLRARRSQDVFSDSNNAKCGQPPGEFNGRLAVEPLHLFNQNVETNRPFQFQKRRPLFVGVHNKALSVAAVRVSNPDCSPVGINR